MLLLKYIAIFHLNNIIEIVNRVKIEKLLDVKVKRLNKRYSCRKAAHLWCSPVIRSRRYLLGQMDHDATYARKRWTVRAVRKLIGIVIVDA